MAYQWGLLITSHCANNKQQPRTVSHDSSKHFIPKMPTETGWSRSQKVTCQIGPTFPQSLGWTLKNDVWHHPRNDKTLPETNISPENRPKPKRKVVFQPSIFRCELLVSGRVTRIFMAGGQKNKTQEDLSITVWVPKKPTIGGMVFVCEPVGFNKTSRDFPDFLARCGRLVGKIPKCYTPLLWESHVFVVFWKLKVVPSKTKKNTSSFCKIPSPLQQTNKNLRKSMKHLVFLSLLLVFYFHSGRIPGKIKVGFHHPNRPNNGTYLLISLHFKLFLWSWNLNLEFHAGNCNILAYLKP